MTSKHLIGLGMVSNLIGAGFVGFTPTITLWGGKTVAEHPWAVVLGWVLIIVGFVLQMVALKEKT